LDKKSPFSPSVLGSKVHGSAPPLAAKAASLITKVILSCGVTYDRSRSWSHAIFLTESKGKQKSADQSTLNREPWTCQPGPRISNFQANRSKTNHL